MRISLKDRKKSDFIKRLRKTPPFLASDFREKVGFLRIVKKCDFRHMIAGKNAKFAKRW